MNYPAHRAGHLNQEKTYSLRFAAGCHSSPFTERGILADFYKLITILTIISFFILGLLNINLYLYQNPGSMHIVHYISKEKVLIEGLVCENPEKFVDRTELTVSARRIINKGNDIPVEGRILISSASDREINYGDFIRFHSRLRTPQSFHNPGGFDYVKYLKYRGVLVRGFVKDSSDIVVLRKNQGNIFKTKLEQFRKIIKKFIEDNSLSPEREIIQAMILGNQNAIPKDIMEKFNMTGTTHIIAISGFNIGIIAFISFFVIRSFMRTSTHLLLRFNIVKVSTIFGIIPVITYMFIAGMGISVVRASIMALTFMIAVILGKERDLYNSLSLAALIILIIAPHSLYDVSFQLSFVAVWAILLITPKFTEIIPENNPEDTSKYTVYVKKILTNTYIFMIISCAATLGTLPLIVFYFNRVSTIVILSNLIVVPIMGIIAIPVCMSIIVALPVSNALALVFLNIASCLMRISISIVDFFASLPGSSFFVSTPTLWEIEAYYLSLIIALKLFEIWSRHKEGDSPESKGSISYKWYLFSFAALIVFFIVNTVYLYVRDIQEDKLNVTFIDVGQGSATLIELPGGKKIVIDGGGTYENIFDIGKKVIAPFLWHKRIKEIDIVILTHPHPDHLNGLIAVLSNFEVKEVWTNGEKGDFDTYEDFMKIITKKNIIHKVVSQNNNTVIDNITLSVFNPVTPIDLKNSLPRKFDRVNNASLVVKLTFGTVSFLFPGDISESTETRLIKSGHNLKSRVMLVPHHGGFTSSTMPFLDKVQPEIAIVSCGSVNFFNDPHREVLKRYSMLGTKILRTDINGAISVTTDGRGITYSTFK